MFSFLGQIERGEISVKNPMIKKLVTVLKIDCNELFGCYALSTSEDIQLTNQITNHIKSLNIKEKAFILSVLQKMDLLK